MQSIDPPHSSVADPAVDLVVRPVAHGGRVQRLAAEAAPEAVAMVQAGSRDHLLGGENFAGTPGEKNLFKLNI